LGQSVSRPTVAVVIPAFNEETTIQDVIRTMPGQTVDYVIVVDDASTDRTSTIARSAGAKVIRHGRNLGVGTSIKSGYLKALSLGARVVVVVAGDGQHDPQEIPTLVEPLLDDAADYVVGDRLSAKSSTHTMPMHRYLGNKLLTYLTGKITGLDVKDSQCGFTAITAAGLKRINFGFLSDRWGIPNDMLLECAMRGLRVKYVPIKTIYRGRESYIKLPGFAIRLLAILARGILRRVYFYRGTAIFINAGGLLILIGLAYGTLVVSETLATGKLPGAGSAILAVAVVLTGTQLLVFGLLAEMIKMMETKISQDRGDF
jgi:glycosyltransferase involved in cell wall biosynthesis